jgi:hypothetical protein
MSPSLRARIVGLGLVLLVLIGASVASATSVLYVTDAEQAKLSTAVVVVTIGDSEVKPSEQFRAVTITRIKVDEVLYGEAPAALSIEQIGGTIDGVGTYVPGDARLEKGERCVLFLRHVGEGWFLTALEQSKYELRDSPRLGVTMHRELHSGLFTRNEQGRLVEYLEPPDRPIKLLSAFRTLMTGLAGQGEAR